jgi:hypothetical protein
MSTYDEIISEFILTLPSIVDDADYVCLQFLAYISLAAKTPGPHQFAADEFRRKPDMALNFLGQAIIPVVDPDAIGAFRKVPLWEAFDRALPRVRETMVDKAQGTIKYDGATYEQAKHRLEKFLAGGFSNMDESVVILLHNIWQVKRKMAMLPVEDHMCGILCSPRGRTGKSVFIHNWIAPLRAFAVPASLSSLADERKYHCYCEAFIVYCEELGIKSTHDKNTIYPLLRDFITAEELSGRSAYERKVATFRNNSTIIAAANIESLDEVLNDSTGNRRFGAMHVTSFVDRIPQVWDAAPFWRSVDENKASPLHYFSDIRQQVIVRQIEESASCINSMEEQWLDERAIVPGGQYFIPCGILRNHYLKNNKSGVNPIVFGRRVSKKLRNTSKKKIGGMCVRGFWVCCPWALNCNMLMESGYMQPENGLAAAPVDDISDDLNDLAEAL